MWNDPIIDEIHKSRDQHAALQKTPAFPEFKCLGLVTLAFALFVGCLYAAHLYRFGWFYMASDDSYIYLGYVRNWIEHGELLTYNPGEPSAGTTGLLYYYLLSAVASVVHFVYWPTPGIGLTLVAYLTNALLFIGSGLLATRIWYSISDARESSLPSLGGTIAVLAATVSLPSFLWGWFGGLENPLSGATLLLLIERVLAKAQGWQIALASAMLGGCRPELLPIGLLVVTLWIARQLAEERNLLILAPRLGASIAAFVGMTLLIYLPCWFVTGSFTPSALGTRIAIPALTDPSLLWQNLLQAAHSGYFTRPWISSVPLLFIGLLTVRRTHAKWVLISVVGILASYFLMRGALGLTNFNYRDRYISFLWPLYTLIAGHILQQMIIRFGWNSLSIGQRRSASLAVALLLSGCVWVGISKANDNLSADVHGVNQVYVFPSQWMELHLPKSARVIMEPAGAIRVFTDFYLLTLLALPRATCRTTSHQLPNPIISNFCGRRRQPTFSTIQANCRTSRIDHGSCHSTSGRQLAYMPLHQWDVLGDLPMLILFGSQTNKSRGL
jgi:hypothetical protein